MTGAHRTSHTLQHCIAVHKVPLSHERRGLSTVGLDGLESCIYGLVCCLLWEDGICRTLNLQTPPSHIS